MFIEGAHNKYGERIALWSTTVGDGSNFVRATRLPLRKLAAIGGD
jgi:hypothetical protein